VGDSLRAFHKNLSPSLFLAQPSSFLHIKNASSASASAIPSNVSCSPSILTSRTALCTHIVHRALQLHNPAAAANTLFVAQQQLAAVCHTNQQRTILAMPGRDVVFVAGSITPAQVATHRPSYINAILIQRSGTVNAVTCRECVRHDLRPFPNCTSIVGQFGGSCGNCKWRDHAARCRPPTPSPSSSPSSFSRPGSDSEQQDAPEHPANSGGQVQVVIHV
jgi:Protein of unknown function (DUF3716)